MNQIFIGKRDVAYAAKNPDFGTGVITSVNEIDQLAPGAIAVFTEDNQLITPATTATSLAGVKQFYIAAGVKTPSNTQRHLYTRRSVLIDRNAFNRFYKKYEAPVRKKMVIGHDQTSTTTIANTGLYLPTLLIPDTILRLRISRETMEEMNRPLSGRMASRYPATDTMRLEVRVRPQDTLTTVLQRMVDKINNHPSNVYLNNPNRTWLTATLVGTTPTLGIELQANIDQQDFQVTSDDVLSYASKTVLTPINFGHGEWRQINEIEERYNIEWGDSNRIHYANFYFDAGVQVENGEIYSTYEWEWETEERNSINSNSTAIQRCILAIPANTSGGVDPLKATFDAVFTAIHQPVTTGSGGGGGVSNI